MQKTISSMTLVELFGSSTDGHIPVLIDITHDALVLGNGQENGHLRLINSTAAVKYKSHQYIPCFFEFTPPNEDGKKINNASISISAIDQSIVQVIRGLRTPPIAIIENFFSRIDNDRFLFSKLGHYEFAMTSVQWDEKTAKWTLVFDPVSQTTVPRALGTKTRCPSICEQSQ